MWGSDALSSRRRVNLGRFASREGERHARVDSPAVPWEVGEAGLYKLILGKLAPGKVVDASPNPGWLRDSGVAGKVEVDP